MTRLFLFSLPTVIAVYMPFCAPAVRPTAPPEVARREMAELWRDPGDVSRADVVYGPWGKEHAPDPKEVFTYKHAKKHGVSPGMTVEDPAGREWSVKIGDEGQVEVLVSRVLSALGYHQPPVYYEQTIHVTQASGTRVMPGGRLRPKEKILKEKGDWSWQQNPFVGTKPYQGLLVLLMMFNSTDLKNSNNSLYELKAARDGATRWYVVRDIGSSLGETGRLDPKRNDPDLFSQAPFVNSVQNGLVVFNYHGYHQELFAGRMTPDDVKWACRLAARLTDAQWHAMFRMTGYEPSVAERFIATLKNRIAQGQTLQ